MTILDLVLLIWFLPAIYVGVSKGFFKQAASIAALVLGVWLAYRYYQPVSGFFAGFFKDAHPSLLNVAGFILVFLGASAVATILGNLLTGLLKAVSLGWVNRILGLLFAVAKTALILTLAVYLFNLLNARLGIIGDGTLHKSAVWCFFNDLSGKIFPFLKELATGSLTT